MHLMTVRTKIILLIIAVITALATVFAATYKPKRVEIIGSPLIKVKALLPLSGPDEHLGNAARRGFEAMLRQAAQTQTRYRYDVVYEDAAAPISDDGAYKAVVSAGLMPEPQIILKLQDQPARSYVFHTPYQDAVDKFIAELPSRDARNIGLIIQAAGNYRELAALLKEKIPEQYSLNGAVFREGQQNFADIINMLRNNDTDLFVIIGAPAETDKLVEQLHRNGISNYQITSLFTVDLTPDVSLYDNVSFVGSRAGPQNSGLAFEALRRLILACENSYVKDSLPDWEKAAAYLDGKASAPGEFYIPAVVKNVRNGSISVITD